MCVRIDPAGRNSNRARSPPRPAAAAAPWNSKRGEEFIRMINAPYCHVPQRATPSRGEGIDMEEMTTRLIRRVPGRAFINGLSQNWISRRLVGARKKKKEKKKREREKDGETPSISSRNRREGKIERKGDEEESCCSLPLIPLIYLRIYCTPGARERIGLLPAHCRGRYYLPASPPPLPPSLPLPRRSGGDV